MNKGIDTFFEPPGTVNHRSCLACGTTCLVKRNQIGPTSWASAMAKAEDHHDYFYCPNSGQDWHDQAISLVQAIEAMPSKRVAALMEQDLFDLLSAHGCIPEAD